MFVVALSIYAGDCDLAMQLLWWIGKLSPCKEFDCIIVADSATPFDDAIEIKEKAEQIFRTVTIVATDRSVKGWPQGPNNQWRTAMRWGAAQNVPVLFLETDAVPLKASWLQELAAAYKQCGQPHLGQMEDVVQATMPDRVLSGVAIYGPGVGRWPIGESYPRAFNVDFANLLVKEAAHTELIRDFFGTEKLPPVFVEVKTPASPINAFTLDWIPEKAVLFHRDKRHSLLPLLHKRLFPSEAYPARPGQKVQHPICVVFPIHLGDAAAAIRHAMWLKKMGSKWDHDAVIAFDGPAAPSARQLQALLQSCFRAVSLFEYPHYPGGYPMAANFMFQCVARHMHEQDSPWFLCEADAVVLRADWLDQLQAEYDRAGRAWMGPHVTGLPHANGSMIYPADAAARMPLAMSCPAGAAWDHYGASDYMPNCHNASHLLMHVWTILNGRPCEVGGGFAPGPITAEQARQWLPRTAVVTHRWKTSHLVDLLLTGQYQH